MKSLIPFLAMAMGGGLMGGRPAKPRMSDEALLKEYELIKQKKSLLPRSERNWIIWQVEDVQKLVKEGETRIENRE